MGEELSIADFWHETIRMVANNHVTCKRFIAFEFRLKFNCRASKPISAGYSHFTKPIYPFCILLVPLGD